MKRVIGPALLLLVAVLSDLGFTHVAGHEGLLAPFGPVRAETLLSGALALTSRLVATCVALPWAAWRLGERVREAARPTAPQRWWRW